MSELLSILGPYLFGAKDLNNKPCVPFPVCFSNDLDMSIVSGENGSDIGWSQSKAPSGSGSPLKANRLMSAKSVNIPNPGIGIPLAGLVIL